MVSDGPRIAVSNNIMPYDYVLNNKLKCQFCKTMGGSSDVILLTWSV